MMCNRKWMLKQLNASLTTPIKYPIILPKHFSSFWYVIAYLLLGAILLPWVLFQRVDIEKTQKNRCWHDQLMPSKQMLAQWQHPVASSEALDLLHQAITGILAHCHGHQNGQQSSRGPGPKTWCFQMVPKSFLSRLIYSTRCEYDM